MRFWDSSAIVPLLSFEDASEAATTLYRSDPVMLVAWTTSVECSSAIARAEHEGVLTGSEAAVAFSRLDSLASAWHEVEPSQDLRDIARRLLRVHRLRAADAIQLAAATLAAEQRPASLAFVTLDDRLETATGKEGFPVIIPGRTFAGS